MDETFLIQNERGKFRLKIWETNKGFYLGAKRWTVSVAIELIPGEPRVWYTLEKQAGDWNSPERAERDGYASLKYWSQHYTGEGVEW